MGRVLRAAGAILVLAASLAAASSAPVGAESLVGSADLSFGSCGVRRFMATSPTSAQTGTADAVAVQPDGRILVAGTAAFPDTAMAVTRLMPDGSMDHSFNTDGSVFPFHSGGKPIVEKLVLQPDGRILVGATKVSWPSGQSEFLVIRLLPDGRLDSSFGGDGEVTVPTGEPGLDLALQPDGKIIVGGSYKLARLMPNGSMDTTFGVNGVAALDEYAWAFALAADGKIVLAYMHDSPQAEYSYLTQRDFGVLRLSADGRPDTSFSADPVDFAGSGDSISDIEVDSEGRIVAAGTVYANGGVGIGLARILASGDPDTTFGTGGKASARLPTGGDVAMVLAPNGAATVAHTVLTPSGPRGFGLSRFTASGQLDTSFGQGGSAMASTGDRDSYARGLAATPSGDWVVSGTVNGSWSGSWFSAVARFQGPQGPAGLPGITEANCVKEADFGLVRGFGTVPVGARVERTARLTSTGTGPFRVRRVALTVSESQAGQYRIVTDTCTGAILPAGQTCSVTVSFAPTAVGQGYGTVTVSDDAGSGWHTAGLGSIAVTALNPTGWGWTGLGQVSNPYDGPTITLPGALSVSAGYYHSLGLKYDGTVWAWGWNGMGQLGDGTNVTNFTPVRVTGLTEVVAVSAGAYHSLAVRRDGSVWAWGWNNYGQLGDGSTVDRNRPVRVQGLTGVTAIAGGWLHSVAVGPGGAVSAWGWNSVGQLGDGSTADRHLPVTVPGLSQIDEVSAGVAHTLALSHDRKVIAWGWNAFGQLGDGTTQDRHLPVSVTAVTQVYAIAAGGYHSLAAGIADRDSRVWAWGWNKVGQLGDGSTESRSQPVVVSGLAYVSSLAAGYAHSVAVGQGDAVWAWGWNVYGQLGVGSPEDRLAPARAPVVRSAAIVSAGALHTLSA